MPSAGFKGRQIPELNQRIYETHKNEALPTVRRDFAASYQQILELAQPLSKKELFERSRLISISEDNVATYYLRVL